MPATSSTTLSALRLLIAPDEAKLAPVVVLAGNDHFLRHEARQTVLRLTSGGTSDDETPHVDELQGNHIEWRDLRDLLYERSLFGEEHKIVLLTDADPFIQRHRTQLEGLVTSPPADAVLIIQAQSWPGNTRLAKQVAKCGLTIRCQVPTQSRELATFAKELVQWLTLDALQRHQVELQPAAANRLLEKLPVEPGVIFQEVSRLALHAQQGGKIDVPLVEAHVGGWRAQRTWDMIDAAAEGRARDALEQLDRLLAAGEECHALLPQMASSLRYLAMAVHWFEQAERNGSKPTLRQALQAAGTPPFKLATAQRQLQQIGRDRARRLYDWLLASDLALKGHNSTKQGARRELETLIVRLAK